mgnify:CR=1 FL=1
MGKGKGKKDKYEDLHPTIKDAIDNGTEEEIRAKLAEVCLAQSYMNAQEEADIDLKEKKAAATEAGAQYSESKKAFKLITGYAHMTLRLRGKVE